MKQLLKNIQKHNCYNISYIRGNNNYVYAYTKEFFCFFRVRCKIQIKYKTEIKLFLRQFYLCMFTKIKFAGKGYKIKKNNKHNLKLLFNRAHLTNLFWKNIFLKKLKKYKIYIQYTNYNYNAIRTILNIRYINIFTKKGLRTSRQILFKKKGKK